MFSRLGAWFAAQSPRGQILSGCLGTLILMTSCFYVLGVGSYFIRPRLFVSPVVVATIIPLPTETNAPSATPVPVITMALPGSTLVSTPTQAPLPTRAPTNTPTATPTAGEMPGVTPLPGETILATATPPPTIESPTVEPPTVVPPTNTRQPTATKRPPTKTPAPPTDTKTPKPTKVPTKGP